ncbi:TldD/PmbA family protein [Rhizomonospora bruguierae]|uniref:TldD/PmbA family protein n=1 Tax=Rhizomonospora bruguierae TaxID=1581705 RepID=UPI001BCADD4A|nr:metallopeptidase TldD-related protein [Micromonospora sp. NBRC 107566]
MSELDVAAQVLELVRAAAGGAEAEVSVDRSVLALTRFATSHIHQNVADDTTSVRLRLHLAGRTASGTTTVTDPAGLRGLVERTVAAARLSPADPGWPGLAPPAPVREQTWDEATAHATPAERAERVRDFVAAAEGMQTAGYCRTVRWTGAFANSAGHCATGRTASAALDGIARRPGADGVARLLAGRLSEVDGVVLGARAAAKAAAGADPVELPPGHYEVVMEPNAVSDLLNNLALFGFNGRLVTQRRSFAEPGADQFDPSLTLLDDPVLTAPYDSEGTPKRTIPLVEAGRTVAVAHDRRSGAEAGSASTGHAPPDGPSSWGAIPLDMALAPGDPDAPPAAEVAGPVVDSSAAELVAKVSRGLLVTDLWYTRVLDERTLAVTGLTRNGVWLIEDGVVTRPVQNFRFTQSYPRALAPGAVLGVGATAARVPDNWALGGYLAPALHLASWHFTGGASG